MTNASSSGNDVVIAADQPLAEESSRRIASIMRMLWFGVIPLFSTTVTWRYLVPRPATLDEGVLRDLAVFSDQHQVFAWPALFLFYSYVARHWRGYLPGARRWSEPPARP